MLHVSDLHVGYGAIAALRGASLEVKEGEVVALIGGNGAGKSTLLRTISGILTPSRGDVMFEGRSLRGMAEDKIVRLGILQVQEGRGILTRMTVQENLEMGAYGRSDKADIRHDMEMVFDKFPVLRERRKQFGATLSGGEQQMLAIGRALMARPKLLMLDEPSLGLAPLLVREIFRIIMEFKREKRTILLVEQNARKALQCADRGYVIETGTIVLTGSGEALLKSDGVQAAYLGDAPKPRPEGLTQTSVSTGTSPWSRHSTTSSWIRHRVPPRASATFVHRSGTRGRIIDPLSIASRGGACTESVGLRRSASPDCRSRSVTTPTSSARAGSCSFPDAWRRTRTDAWWAATTRPPRLARSTRISRRASRPPAPRSPTCAR